MQSPLQQRHYLYWQLYLAERTRHEQIRGSIGIPVTAAAFTVYAFSSVATYVDVTKWQYPSSLLLFVFVLGSLAAATAGAISLIRVEWRLTYHEPPDLDELLRAEQDLRTPEPGADGERNEQDVGREMTDLLTGAYFIAYRHAFLGNAVCAKYRARAVRFLILSLLLLFVAYAILPFHLALSPS